jgi:integrase
MGLFKEELIDKPVLKRKSRCTNSGIHKKDAQLIDNQALLGHESIATTQMIYIHSSQERLSKLVADI